MDHLLEFMYTGKLPPQGHADSVLSAAVHLQMDELLQALSRSVLRTDEKCVNDRKRTFEEQQPSASSHRLEEPLPGPCSETVSVICHASSQAAVPGASELHGGDGSGGRSPPSKRAKLWSASAGRPECRSPRRPRSGEASMADASSRQPDASAQHIFTGVGDHLFESGNEELDPHRSTRSLSSVQPPSPAASATFEDKSSPLSPSDHASDRLATSVSGGGETLLDLDSKSPVSSSPPNVCAAAAPAEKTISKGRQRSADLPNYQGHVRYRCAGRGSHHVTESSDSDEYLCTLASNAACRRSSSSDGEASGFTAGLGVPGESRPSGGLAPSAAQTYQCDVCERSFSQRGSLNRHVRSHLGVKPYSCPRCPMTFSRQYRVTEHMRVHQHGCEDAQRGASRPGLSYGTPGS
ncbi:protein glass-like [Denticeps clupeoides]|uniref:C2H2-type domain-containing protein n=1 Tax=Denticeps clupeoides TaxID=299321 RepID=A0AAY4EN49_9TELE|nr:protein glass-like [Denticeps clupeoides]